MSYHGVGATVQGKVACKLQGGRMVCTTSGSAGSGGSSTQSAPAPCPTPGELRLASGCCPIPKISSSGACCKIPPYDTPAYAGGCASGFEPDSTGQCCKPRMLITEPGAREQVLLGSYIKNYSWSGPPPPAPSGATCLNDLSAIFVANCLANPQAQGCENALAVIALSRLPFCAGTSRAPIPGCLDPATMALLAYCDSAPEPWLRSSGAEGAACWAAMKDPAWYNALKAVAPCAAGEGGGEETKAGMSTGAMVGIGVAAVAVLGLGYMMLRRKP